MRIGIDCRTMLNADASQQAGVSHYTYYLVKYLLRHARGHTFVFFFNEVTNAKVIDEIKSFESRSSFEIQYFKFSKYKKFLPFIYSHILVAGEIMKQRLDIYHSPANIVPLRLLMARSRPKLVATIHDLAIYKFPKLFPAGQWFSIKFLVPQTIQRVDHVIVPSMITRDDIVSLFGISNKKASVIPLGVEGRFFQKSDIHVHAVPKKYILYLGTIEPRKNISRLIDAYARMPNHIIKEYSLVVAGGNGWKYKEVYEKIKNLDAAIRAHIHFTGYVQSEYLPPLMQHASVFVFPSLYEGFGMPVLEAMASGIPVITSYNSSMSEFVDDETGILVDPRSSESIKKALVVILSDDIFREKMGTKASLKARDFSWKKTAEKTVSVYELIA